MFIRDKKRRNHRVNPKHKFYEKLRVFHEKWEAAGGTRGTLRKARKSAHTLFPALPQPA